MSSPVLVQSNIVVPAAPLPAAGGVVTCPWKSATGAGHRILAFIGEVDNQIDSITVTSAPAGFVETNPPGDIVRVVTAHPAITGRWYQKVAGVAGEAAVSFTIAPPSAGPSGVYPVLIIAEVSGAHATDHIDTGVENGVSGSSNTPSVSSPATTRPDVLWLAAFITGNIQAHSIPTGSTSGFALKEARNSGGATSAAKASASLLSKAASAAGETATADIIVSGGSSKNYVGLIIGIPGTGGGGGGGGGSPGADAAIAAGMPASGRGVVRRAMSGHYSGAIPDVATAQKIGAIFDIAVHNVDTNPATGSVSLDKYNGFLDEIRTVNPDFKAAPYRKGPQISEGVSYYPNDYYAHTCPWPSGSKITTYKPSIYVAQPSVPAGQSAYVDPRGWTAHSFKEQRARDSWGVVDRYNQVKGTAGVPDPLNAVYADSMGTSSWKGTQCDPSTGKVYTSRQIWQDLVWSIGDELISRGSGRLVLCNGLITGSSFYGSAKTQDMLTHCHGGIAENWQRNNFDPPTAYPSEDAWIQDMNMVIDTNAAGKLFWGVINLCNAVAGGSGHSCTGWTAALLEQVRRFTIAGYLFADRGWALFEFVENSSTKRLWDEDHPYYHVDLGAPLDSPTIINKTDTTHGKTAEGQYRRRFQNGVSYINPTASPVTFHHDRDYKDPPGSGSALYASGSAMTLPAHSAIVLLTQATTGANAGAPVVTINGPATSIGTVNTTVRASAVDPDGIASVEVRINGGAWQPMSFSAPNWTRAVTLTTGANTIDVRATDANASPLTSAPVTRTVTVTPNSGPPAIAWINPATPFPRSLIDAIQLVQVQVTDTDGVAWVRLQLNNGPVSPMAFNPVSGYYEKSISLVEGNNTLVVTAADVRPPAEQLTSTSTAVAVLTTTPPPPPPPPGPTPDPTQVRSLGVGIYTAWVLTRGGAQKVVEIPWTGTLPWQRKSRGVTQATATVEGADALETCASLADVHAYQHELAIYYQPTKSAAPIQQWVGPIVSIVGDPQNQKVTITAKDLAQWYARRRLKQDHTFTDPGTDLSTIAQAYHQDAISQDPSPNIKLALVPAGVLAVADHPALQHMMADAAIAELTTAGLYWFMVNRSLRNVDLTRPGSPVTQLLDEHFAEQPVDTEDGDAIDNERGVRGQGGGQTDTIWGEASDADSITSYGLLSAVDQTNAITNEQAAADAAALLAGSKDPHPMITGGKLNQNAPITRALLLPGNRVVVVLSKRCRVVSGTYTMDQIDFTPSADGTEAVQVTFL